jgi:hypothetical protein
MFWVACFVSISDAFCIVLGQMWGIYQVAHLQLFSTLSAKFSESYLRFSEFMPLNHNYLEFRNFVGEGFF